MRTMQKAAVAAVVLGLFWPGCATWGPGDPNREDDGGDASGDLGGDDNIGRPPTTNGSGNPSQGMGASGAGASGEGSGPSTTSGVGGAPTTTSSGVGGAPTTTSSGVGGTSSSSTTSSTASSSSSTTSTSSSSSTSTSSSSGSGGGPTSVGCLVDGFCTLDDDCVCADCDTDPFCSDPTNCTNDNVCDPFNEGCVCADCATTHPECLN